MEKIRDEKSLSQIMDYLHEDLVYNVYILGDIHRYGMNSNRITLWADYCDHRVNYVVMRYMDSFVISPIRDTVDTDSLMQIFSEVNIRCISGCSNTIEKIKPMFDRYVIDENRLLTLDSDTHLGIGANNCKVAKLDPCDRTLIQEVYLDNEEFKEKYKGESGLRRIEEIFSNGSYYGYIDDNDRLIAVACISADSGDMGVLDGVAVRDSSRFRRIGSTLVSTVCSEEIEDKRLIITYCNSPVAEHIYRKVGFRECGRYMLLYPQ